MSDASRKHERLALQGGMKAVSGFEGRGQPKIGPEEFLSIAERFGLSERAMAGIRAVLDEEDFGEGPFLANYYSGLKETKVEAFQRVARETFGVPHAIGVCNGTAALHAAFVAVGVGPGTEVICPAIGFMATAAAVVMAKGVPVFCDVDASLSMDPAALEAAITPRTVAVAPTCVMGSVPDMPAIMAVARGHGLKVVEDCAQSCGGSVGGRYVGTFGDAGCFSISAYKIIGGGEGGLLLAGDEGVWARANQLMECGGLWRPDRFAPPRWAGELFAGTNYRMSELEAAVDAIQLAKVHDKVRRFRAVKQRISRQLPPCREIAPQRLNDADGEVGYTLRFFPESIDLAVRIVEALRAEGVGCSTRGRNPGRDWHIYHDMFPITERTGWTDIRCPYECPHYTGRGGAVRYGRGDCPVADDLYDRAVTVHLNQWLTDADCDNVAAALNKVFDAYCTPDAGAAPWPAGGMRHDA
ncbi:MAG: aminotransferase class V-fold PLP-dependent enzyme [Planctomycetes bacterium]|nr:aminotransferase class V-fold PLP-dependent enzyme [Planctomycetota bacterium]